MHSYLHYISIGMLLANLFILDQLRRARVSKYVLFPLLIAAVFFSFWPQAAFQFPPASRLWAALALTGNIWQVLTFFSILSFILVGLALLLRGLYRRASGRGRYPLPIRHRLVLVLFLTIACTVYAVAETHGLKVTRLTVNTAKLAPGSAPVRIAFVSDVHLHEFTGPGRLRRIVDCINGQNPDIVLNGGDLVDADMSGRSRDAEILAELKPRYGSLGVTGNHEARHGMEDNSLPFMRRAGIQVLRGEAVEAGGIIIAGVDDPDVKQEPGRDLSDPIPILKNLRTDSFVLLLKHNPELHPEAIGLFDLMLAGHTHGGQILPFKYLAQHSYKMPQGELCRISGPNGASLAYITHGTGFGRTPFRFFIPPEVVIIDLVPEQP